MFAQESYGNNRIGIQWSRSRDGNATDKLLLNLTKRHCSARKNGNNAAAVLMVLYLLKIRLVQTLTIPFRSFAALLLLGCSMDVGLL